MNKLIPVLAALGGLSAAHAQTVTLADETFAAGERGNLNVPAGLQWFSSAGGTNVTYVADTSITQNTGTSGRHLLGYFTADGNAASLAQGDTLTLTMTVTFNRATPLAVGANNFRFGLFNSTDGTRVATDNHGGTSASATFDNYTGYAAMFNLGSSDTGTASVRERTTLTNTGFIATAGAYTALGSNDSPGAAFVQNTPYTFTYSLTRTAADRLAIVTSVVSTTLGAEMDFSFTREDETPSTFAFDTLGVLLTSNTADGFTLNTVTIEQSAIPEPSAFAAIAGLGGLAFAAMRRRRG